jgi:oligopeptide/dipeptide ABC transporter ATP-binding protein
MSELLTVDGLTKHYEIGKSVVRAVDGVSLRIGSRESLGLVGESGCGKSTVGRSILRLVEPTGGTVRFDGKDVLGAPAREMRDLRRDMQIIFQDPFSALNPRLTVAQAVEEPLVIHGGTSRAERRAKVDEILGLVGLRPEQRDRFPHEFSGGQRQRIGIARALIVHPRFVVADEAVSALDVSVQAQILNLMHDLQERLGLSMLFISHDLGVIRYVCQRVAVMYLGRIVELGRVEDVIREPLHPYSQLLLSAVPKLDPRRRSRRGTATGELPSPLDPPKGCAFHTRCPHRMPVCERIAPAMSGAAPDRSVACHLFGDSPAAKPASIKRTSDEPAGNHNQGEQR